MMLMLYVSRGPILFDGSVLALDLNGQYVFSSRHEKLPVGDARHSVFFSALWANLSEFSLIMSQVT